MTFLKQKQYNPYFPQTMHPKYTVERWSVVIQLPYLQCYICRLHCCTHNKTPPLTRQACSPLIQLFFGFASDIDQRNINTDIRDGNWLATTDQTDDDE